MNIKINDYKLIQNKCFECKLEKKNLLQNKLCYHKICNDCLFKTNPSHQTSASVQNFSCDCKFTFTSKDFSSKLNYEILYELEKNARKLYEDNNLKLENDFKNIELYNDYQFNTEVTVYDLLNNQIKEKTTADLEKNKHINNDKNKIIKEGEYSYFKRLTEVCNPLSFFSSIENYNKSFLLLFNKDNINLGVLNNNDKKVSFTKVIREPQHIPTLPKTNRNLLLEKKAGGCLYEHFNMMNVNYFYESLYKK